MSNEVESPYRQNPAIHCGRCGILLSEHEADIGEQGHLCLSCSTDVKMFAAANEARRDQGRIAFFAALVLPVFIVYGSFSVQIGAGVLLALSAFWVYRWLCSYSRSLKRRPHKL